MGEIETWRGMRNIYEKMGATDENQHRNVSPRPLTVETVMPTLGSLRKEVVLVMK